jgi:serine/threonine-protein kinase
MIGSTLDKYEVLQKVGEGGMATVYRGRHATLGRDVAIKVLHPHLSSSTRNRKRFAREARAIEQLRHDNILEIYDYSGADAEDCYIVTEFVGGRTLSSWMDEYGRLPSEVAAIIGIALSRALAYAHAQAVLHRDLKPDNVMIRHDGTVKLMDFGIARFLDESQVTMTGALVGSPAFMSPEQAKEGDLDARSDLFSLGNLLFYLVSGHLPFAGSNPSLMLKNIIEGNRPALAELAPGASASMCDVVERLLQTNREARFDDARQVEEHLRASLAEVEVEPSDPRWSLAAWLEDADAYRRRLDQHLREVLLRRGRRLLEEGEALAALRLLNRLLSIDEDNAEVLALVQGLGNEPGRSTTGATQIGRVVGVAAALCLLIFGGLGGAWAMWGPVPPPPAASGPAVAPEPRVESPSPPIPIGLSEPPASPPPALAALPAAVSSVSSPNQARSVSPVLRPVPRPTVDPPTKIEPRLPETGCLEVRATNGSATIRLDGSPTGRKTNDARGCMQVQPGIHRISLAHPLIDWEQDVEVTIAPGETSRLDLTLRYKPVTVVFPPTIDGSCGVQVDGRARGGVEELGRRLDLAREPRRTTTVTLVCPGIPTITRSFSENDDLQVTWAAP